MENIKMEVFNPDKHDLDGFKTNNVGQNYVFLEDGKVIGRANIHFSEREIYIGTIDAKVEGLGYGKKMINHIKQTYSNYDLITGDTTQKAKGFWEKMGAIMDECYDGEFYIQIDPSKNIKPIF